MEPSRLCRNEPGAPVDCVGAAAMSLSVQCLLPRQAGRQAEPSARLIFPRLLKTPATAACRPGPNNLTATASHFIGPAGRQGLVKASSDGRRGGGAQGDQGPPRRGRGDPQGTYDVRVRGARPRIVLRAARKLDALCMFDSMATSQQLVVSGRPVRCNTCCRFWRGRC